MRIKTLSLMNYRLFGEPTQTIEFNQDRNVTIIVGNNGAGKTSILDAIAVQLSSWISQFPGYTLRQYKESDVHINNNGERSSFLEIATFFYMHYDEEIYIKRVRKGNVAKLHGTNNEYARDLAEKLLEQIKNGEDCTLPLVAYYGTGRGQIQAPERKRNFQKTFSRWDCYKDTLDASTNFKRFFVWFDQMEDEERREREKRRDFDYQLPVLKTVREALSKFIGEKYTKPRIETKPLRFVVDEHTANGKRELRIEQLSDGYKIVTAMIADIASRMAEANPDMPNPLHTPGIVLIDEIDLHLHPKWQREIISKLEETFPNIQFIVTTHSPILLLGAIEKSQILLMNNTEIKDLTSSSYETYDISQILLSDIFGLSSSRAPQWDEKITEQEKLLSKTILTNKEKERLDELNKELSALSFGTSLESINTRKMIQEIAEKLNIH